MFLKSKSFVFVLIMLITMVSITYSMQEEENIGAIERMHEKVHKPKSLLECAFDCSVAHKLDELLNLPGDKDQLLDQLVDKMHIKGKIKEFPALEPLVFHNNVKELWFNNEGYILLKKENSNWYLYNQDGVLESSMYNAVEFVISDYGLGGLAYGFPAVGDDKGKYTYDSYEFRMYVDGKKKFKSYYPFTDYLRKAYFDSYNKHYASLYIDQIKDYWKNARAVDENSTDMIAPDQKIYVLCHSGATHIYDTRPLVIQGLASEATLPTQALLFYAYLKALSAKKDFDLKNPAIAKIVGTLGEEVQAFIQPSKYIEHLKRILIKHQIFGESLSLKNLGRFRMFCAQIGFKTYLKK